MANAGQASLPMWADRFAMQWQRGQGGGGGVAPWMQERVAQVSNCCFASGLVATDVSDAGLTAVELGATALQHMANVDHSNGMSS